jgi:hypothetical protein
LLVKKVGVSILGFLLAATLSAQVTISGMTLSDVEIATASAASSGTTKFVMPLNLLTTVDNDGANPIADTCLCNLVLTIAMDEISHIGVWVGGGSVDGVEEIGVYSLDGQTKYFDGAFGDVTIDGRIQIANTLGTIEVPQSNVWICVAKDSTSAGWVMPRANNAVLTIDNYRHTETCTDGLVPDTITPSGSYNNSRRTLYVLEDLD